MSCGTCGGIGLSGEKCPECGLDRNSSKALTRQDITALIPLLEDISVPKNYIGVYWDPSIFWVSHGNQKGNKLVELVVNQMEKIHSIFSNGRTPERSAILMAPSNYSKVTFMYSCMQYALKSGFSVTPLLDTSEIKRLFVLASESPTQKVGGVDYDTYIASDVCFFTVQKNEYRRNCYATILDLLDKRSRRGLVTLGISRYSVSELSRWDRSGDFKKLTVPSPGENQYKIPALISCL